MEQPRRKRAWHDSAVAVARGIDPSRTVYHTPTTMYNVDSDNCDYLEDLNRCQPTWIGAPLTQEEEEAEKERDKDFYLLTNKGCANKADCLAAICHPL